MTRDEKIADAQRLADHHAHQVSIHEDSVASLKVLTKEANGRLAAAKKLHGEAVAKLSDLKGDAKPKDAA